MKMDQSDPPTRSGQVPLPVTPSQLENGTVEAQYPLPEPGPSMDPARNQAPDTNQRPCTTARNIDSSTSLLSTSSQSLVTTLPLATFPGGSQLPAPSSKKPPSFDPSADEIYEHFKRTPHTGDQNAAMWDEYNRMADKEDREFVKAANENLNTLLIFAGIFAAINASFILETFKSLKQDPQETSNDLLHVIAYGNTQNSTEHPLNTPFSPTHRDIRINFLFFSSLCTSLAASFLAVMGKQWLSHYEHEGSLKPPAERARERQRKFEGREKHHLQGVVESLPALLQASLFVFLVGMADLLWPLSLTVSGCVIFFACSILIAWVALTISATWSAAFPYQTRLSIVLRRIAARGRGQNSPRDDNLTTDIRIIGQMLKNTTFSDVKRLSMLADCLEALPDSTSIRELGIILTKFFLEPLLVTASVPWFHLKEQVIREEFRSLGMLRIIRAMVRPREALALELDVLKATLLRIWVVSWEDVVEPERAEVIADIVFFQAMQMEALCRSLSLIHLHGNTTLASALCSRLLNGGLDVPTTAACLNLIHRCLPQKYYEDEVSTDILNNLAKYFESLPTTSPHILSLSKTMMEFTLWKISPSFPIPEESRSMPDAFRSVPMLRFIRILFKSPSALRCINRKTIISRLWLRFWLPSTGMERAEIIADILTLDVVVVERIERRRHPVGQASLEANNQLQLAILLASRLCGRLKNTDVDEDSAVACLNLLQHLLPPQQPEMAQLLEGLAQNLQRSATDRIYLICTSTFLRDLVTNTTASYPKHVFLNALQEPGHLQHLYDILNNPSNQAIDIAHGGLGLAICMALWHHSELDNPSQPPSVFYTPSWFNTITLLLKQSPLNSKPRHLYERHPFPINITQDEGFCMLDRLSRYFSAVCQHEAGLSLTLREAELIRVRYKKWCAWAEGPDFTQTWSKKYISMVQDVESVLGKCQQGGLRTPRLVDNITTELCEQTPCDCQTLTKCQVSGTLDNLDSRLPLQQPAGIVAYPGEAEHLNHASDPPSPSNPVHPSHAAHTPATNAITPIPSIGRVLSAVSSIAFIARPVNSSAPEIGFLG